MNKIKLTQSIKNIAKDFGFLDCKIAQAKELTQEAKDLEKWLNANQHGEMSYMENHFDLRTDTRKLVPGAKSVISLSYNYFPEKTSTNPDFKIAKYAYGRDYHKVIRKKLKHFLHRLEEIQPVSGRGFVDSAPIMEKVWAKKSGLTWQGKSTNAINPRQGSFFFLAALVIDWELEYDGPIKDYCGTCTKCIDACPTNALKPYQIDGSKCISYLTIELKNEIPREFQENMENWAFGCDICQDVCPWNRFSAPHHEPDFEDKTGKLLLSKIDLLELTENAFEKTFMGSAIKRTGIDGLKRNIKFLEEK